MEIKGLEDMSMDQLSYELRRGGKFLVFEYCVSAVIITFKRSSAIYFLRADESALGKIYKFTLISLLFGWWGLPFGPIYTITTILTNIKGGKDVTEEVMAALTQSATGSPL